MELALYHPELGYYERTGGQVGRTGDFYTSVSVGSLFGELLAFQFADWVAADERLEKAPKIELVEAGAHDGRLAGDILGGLQTFHPQIFQRVIYRIIEPSARRRSWQSERLAAFADRIEWLEALPTAPDERVCGFIFANELLDAFPAHRLGWDSQARCWFEWRVAAYATGLAWTREPLLTGDGLLLLVEKYLGVLPAELLAVLPDGFTTELSPTSEAWWSQAARGVGIGRLLTFDYGLRSEEFFLPSRQAGTLRGFRGHHQVSDLLAVPGEQDLTADVNFSRLQVAGETAGLRTEFMGSQGKFLTGILQRTMTRPERFPAWTPARTRQFQTLTHPEHLGRAFRVLVQEKLCS